MSRGVLNLTPLVYWSNERFCRSCRMKEDVGLVGNDYTVATTVFTVGFVFSILMALAINGSQLDTRWDRYPIVLQFSICRQGSTKLVSLALVFTNPNNY